MRRLPAVLLLAVCAGVYNCGSSDEHHNAPGAAGQGAAGEAGAPTRDETGGNAGELPNGGAGGLPDHVEAGGVGGTPSPAESGGVAGVSNEAGAGPSAGAGGASLVELPDGPIVNVPYTCSSPFDGVSFPSFFYLDDFEDGMVNTPGITSTSTTTSANSGSTALVDSVDCDDGVDDGTCVGCDALFSSNGAIQVTFDAQVLGALPTHVGMVWTDGGYGSTVTVTGYDAADQVIYTETVQGIGDNSNYGETAEDRFFGIVHYAGIKSVKLANTSGGIEIDHLQYGR